MDLLSDDQLHLDPIRRTSIVQASMSRATHTIINYNWYAAGLYVGAMPSIQEMIEYGTVWSVVYHDEGADLSTAIFEGIRAMSDLAWNEGKGVVTRAKKMLAPGHKYGTGSIPSRYAGAYVLADTPEEEHFDLNTKIASLGLEPAEERVLVLTAHGYTPQDILDELGEKAPKILEEALAKAREVWNG